MAKHETSWILELMDRVSGPAKKVMDSVSGITGKAQGMVRHMNALGAKGDEIFAKLGRGFGKIRDYASEIPILGSAIELLSNPVAIVGALATGFTLMASQAIQANNEIVASQTILQASMNVTGEEMEGLNAKFVATSRVFQRDTSEMVTAANALKSEYEDLGMTGEGALNLIQKGLIATGNRLELRQIQEYSAQMRAAGVDAEGTIALIAQSQRMGVFDDKGIDAVKEFGLRLREMTPAAAEALKAIGLSSTGIMKELDSGSKTTFEVLQDVSGALANASTQAQQTAIADLFGGPGEDAGIRFLTSLKDMNLELDGMIDKNNPLIAAQLRNLELQEKLAARQQAVSPFITEMQLRFEEIKLSIGMLFYDAFQWIIENKSMIIGVLTAIAGSVAGVAAGLGIMKLAAFSAAASAKGMTIAQYALNTAMKANPIGAVITGISILVGLVVWAWNEFEVFRGVVVGVWESVKVFGQMLYDMVIVRLKDMLSGITGIGAALKAFFSGDFTEAWEIGKKAVGDLSGANSVGQMVDLYKSAGADAADAFVTGYSRGVQMGDGPEVDVTAGGQTGMNDNPFGSNDLNLNGKTPGGTGSTTASSTGIEGGTGSKIITMNIGDINMSFTLPAELRSGATDAANEVARILTEKLRNGLALGS